VRTRTFAMGAALVTWAVKRTAVADG
jgi:hypothetical protein